MNRKLFLILTLTAALALPVLAQENTPEASDQGWKGGNPCAHMGSGKMGKHGGHGMGRMAKQLNLTADQKSQLEAMRKDTRSQVEGVCNDKSLSDQQKADKVRDIRKSQHEKMMALLTPEQQEKFKQMRQERAGKRHHHGGKKGGNTGTTTTPPVNPPSNPPQ
jgi:Spy/CpxP family protein refolding chaperone